MKALFIAFDQAYYEHIVELLPQLGSRGFTAWQEVQGRGSKTGEPHYGTHAWPSLASAMMTMVEDNRVDSVTMWTPFCSICTKWIWPLPNWACGHGSCPWSAPSNARSPSRTQSQAPLPVSNGACATSCSLPPHHFVILHLIVNQPFRALVVRANHIARRDIGLRFNPRQMK